MEIIRKIYSKISDWKKETNGNKALLVEGARRIGKSTVVEEFARKEYRSYILIDFNKAKKKIKDVFNELDSLDEKPLTRAFPFYARKYFLVRKYKDLI